MTIFYLQLEPPKFVYLIQFTTYLNALRNLKKTVSQLRFCVCSISSDKLGWVKFNHLRFVFQFEHDVGARSSCKQWSGQCSFVHRFWSLVSHQENGLQATRQFQGERVFPHFNNLRQSTSLDLKLRKRYILEGSRSVQRRNPVKRVLGGADVVGPNQSAAELVWKHPRSWNLFGAKICSRL